MEEGRSAQSSRKEVEETVAVQEGGGETFCEKGRSQISEPSRQYARGLQGQEAQEIQKGDEEEIEEEIIMSDQLTLHHVADEMQGIDIAILSTHDGSGRIACRPMSNNGDVKYDGTSYFFSYEQASCVSDIDRDPNVALGYSSSGLISG